MNRIIIELLEMRNGSIWIISKEAIRIEFGLDDAMFIHQLKLLSNFEVEDQGSRFVIRRVR